MAKRVIIKQQTWPCIEELIEFLLTKRNNEEHSSTLRVGINHSVIFYSACYLEGIIESGLKAILSQKREVFNTVDIPELYARKTVNRFFNSLESDIEERIARTTGVPNYDKIFELLTGERISKYNGVNALWEGIEVLFQFRNVLAHGREISASKMSAYWIEEPWKEFYSGGYKKAEDYLLKKGLIAQKFIDCDSEELYFTDGVADHFWGLSKEFVYQVSNGLPEDAKEAFDGAVLAR